VGAFERHTKGFGSKMMAKMGFVEGKGLGSRESQGIVSPLTALRLTKVDLDIICYHGMGISFESLS